MRKWVVYLAVFGLLLITDALGFSGTDVGKLLPVEAVRISSEAGKVLVETDTGDKGAGADLKEALENLRDTAAGNVFLETADYLILQFGCEKYLAELCHVLRPSCGLCLEEKQTDLQKATEFLAVHRLRITMRDWCGGEEEIPMLVEREGRVQLVP